METASSFNILVHLLLIIAVLGCIMRIRVLEKKLDELLTPTDEEGVD